MRRARTATATGGRSVHARGKSHLGVLHGEHAPVLERPRQHDLRGNDARRGGHRISSMILDNQATGTNRVIREIAAGIINPAALLNRLLRGEASNSSTTPPTGSRRSSFSRRTSATAATPGTRLTRTSGSPPYPSSTATRSTAPSTGRSTPSTSGSTPARPAASSSLGSKSAES